MRFRCGATNVRHLVSSGVSNVTVAGIAFEDSYFDESGMPDLCDCVIVCVCVRDRDCVVCVPQDGAFSS